MEPEGRSRRQEQPGSSQGLGVWDWGYRGGLGGEGPSPVAVPLFRLCFILLVHEIRRALCLALLNEGSSIAAKMAIIAITTRSSMRVKMLFLWGGA